MLEKIIKKKEDKLYMSIAKAMLIYSIEALIK